MFQRQPAIAIQAAGESAASTTFRLASFAPERLVAQRRGRFDLFTLIQLCLRALLRRRRGRNAARALGSVDPKPPIAIGLWRRERDPAREYLANGPRGYRAGS